MGAEIVITVFEKMATLYSFSLFFIYFVHGNNLLYCSFHASHASLTNFFNWNVKSFLFFFNLLGALFYIE